MDKYTLRLYHILSLSILLVCVDSFNTIIIYALASSPSFPRQVQIEPPHEWQYFPLSVDYNCTGIAHSVQIPQMTGVSYFSDGKVLNATIWLSDALEIRPTPSVLRIPTYTMGIGIIQSYSTSAKVDYAITVQWNPLSQTWSRTLEEFLANGTRILQQDNNYTDFDNIANKGYVNLSLDLSDISSPAQYFIAFLGFDTDTSKRPICGLVGNIGRQIYVPPPDFSISVSPNPLQIKQGEERTIELRANSSSLVKPLLSISKVNEPQGVDISISPSSAYIPAGGMATSLVKVKANDSAEPGPRNIEIHSNISFPVTFNAAELVGVRELGIRESTIQVARALDSEASEIQGLDQSQNNSSTGSNNMSSIISPRPSYFSIIITPYSAEERFRDFWNTYGGIVGLIGGGFAAGLSALIIDRLRKKGKVSKTDKYNNRRKT